MAVALHPVPVPERRGRIPEDATRMLSVAPSPSPPRQLSSGVTKPFVTTPGGCHHPSGGDKATRKDTLPSEQQTKGRCRILRPARTHSPGLRSGWLGGCERQIFLILSKEILFRLKPV